MSTSADVQQRHSFEFCFPQEFGGGLKGEQFDRLDAGLIELNIVFHMTSFISRHIINCLKLLALEKKKNHSELPNVFGFVMRCVLLSFTMAFLTQLMGRE